MEDCTIKNLIKSYGELRAKKDIFEEIFNTSVNIENRDEYERLKIKLKIIESSFKILTKDEREIVTLHLIENLKWNEILAIYDDNVGMENTYSDRTFKRIQKNALQKIEKFICDNQFERYIA